MAEGRAKLEWDQTALLWSLTANINRDPKEKREPFLPSDVHPHRKPEDYGAATEEEKRAKAIDGIKRTYRIRKLSYGQFDRSRPGIPATLG